MRTHRRVSRAALLTGRVLVGTDGRPDPMNAAMAARVLGTEPDLPGPSVMGFLACAAVVRRGAFLSVGGFNPRPQMYGEEALLAMDLASGGWVLAFVPSLVVRRLAVPSGRDSAARRRRQARNDLVTAWLRRPIGVGVRAAAEALGSPAGRGDALPEVPWVLRNRHPLPSAVEAAVRRSGQPQSVAASYASVSHSHT